MKILYATNQSFFPVTSSELLSGDGEVKHFKGFFSPAESDVYFEALLKNVDWKQRPIRIFGKEVMQPRLTASFADKGVNYGYSGVQLRSAGWSRPLSGIKKSCEEFTGLHFNTALLNLYRNGNDYMGWHRDNEKSLGVDPAVLSISFGARRIFQLRRYDSKKERVTLELGHGDMLLMTGPVQKFWEHRLPRVAGLMQARINITFREVV